MQHLVYKIYLNWEGRKSTWADQAHTLAFTTPGRYKINFIAYFVRMEREQDPEKGAVVHFDVEAVLERIRLDLDVGELFASPAFDLTNAMTAMEIGDPKMDPGMHRYDQKTLSERIAGGEAPVHFDNTVDVLAIMDRLLQLEIGWHDHYMLSQTVYTCLYMMDMERWVVDVCMLS